jgi:hypothetical protein
MPQRRRSTTRRLPTGNRVTISVGSRRGRGLRMLYPTATKTVSVRRPDGTGESRSYRRGSFLTRLLGGYSDSVPKWGRGSR